VETSSQPGFLERPEEAFSYYAAQGVRSVVLEEKHMGSRAVMVICRDAEVARERFGVLEDAGVIYTRTGRRFFSDLELERALLERVRAAMTSSGFWEALSTDWVVLDGELMPWSAKAQSLLQQQYAPVGAAARASLTAAVKHLEAANVPRLLEAFQGRLESVSKYREAYARYCWEVRGPDDYRFAPFHLLATEGKVHADQSHLWHLEQLGRICDSDPTGVLFTTAHRIVDLEREDERLEAIRWWEDLTASGGEGMVCKPLEFIAQGKKGLVQPAVKVRGQEYLRIIYGAEYTLPHHLERLRARGLSAKRSLASREFALGIESLERFVRREPLRRTHEAVFAVLALESEPVDPRL
jgi:protein phosphatase